MKMSETITELERLFDELNKHYFDSALPKPVITVQTTPKAYGHCTTKQIWRADSEAAYEINLGAEYINRPIVNVAATMLHEMVHLFCITNQISDTSQNGRYHNTKFKTEAEKRDLLIEYDRANGWSITKTTETFETVIRDLGFTKNFASARMLSEKRKTTSRAKQIKYTCPCCGQTVKSTAVLNLICGICELEMVANS